MTSVRVLAIGILVTLSAAADAGDDKKPSRISDVIYGRKDGLALTMDVFLPTKKPNGAAVVMIVSGGFNSSHDRIIPSFNTELLERGYTCFVVVHGSQPRYTVPEIRDDLNRAVRFIRYNAKKYQIDPNRIGATGGSSGGNLALLLGTAPQPGKANAADPVDRVDSNVQAVTAFFPPTDYLNYGGPGKEFFDPKMHSVPFRAAYDFREFNAKEGLFQTITDKDKIRAIYKDISPSQHVTAKTAPTLLIHGDKDDLVPLQQSETFHAKMTKAKVACKLDVRKGAGHGWLTIIADMNHVADWYDEHLKGKVAPVTFDEESMPPALDRLCSPCILTPSPIWPDRSPCRRVFRR